MGLSLPFLSTLLGRHHHIHISSHILWHFCLGESHNGHILSDLVLFHECFLYYCFITKVAWLHILLSKEVGLLSLFFTYYFCITYEPFLWNIFITIFITISGHFISPFYPICSSCSHLWLHSFPLGYFIYISTFYIEPCVGASLFSSSSLLWMHDFSLNSSHTKDFTYFSHSFMHILMFSYDPLLIAIYIHTVVVSTHSLVYRMFSPVSVETAIILYQCDIRITTIFFIVIVILFLLGHLSFGNFFNPCPSLL